MRKLFLALITVFVITISLVLRVDRVLAAASVSVNPTSGPVGTLIYIHIANFCAPNHKPIIVKWDSQGIASTLGPDFTITYTVPADTAPAVHTVSAVGAFPPECPDTASTSFTVTAPPQDQGNTGDTSGDQTDTGNTGSQNSNSTTQISTSIGKPSELKAEYIESSKGTKLSWKKSASSDIDGYRIYRSEQEKTGFSSIAEVKKDILEYLDVKDLANDKTYYYLIRAYKSNKESGDSNTASIKIPAEKAIAVSENQPISSENGYRLEDLILAVLITVGGALVVTLAIYEILRWRKGQKIISNDRPTNES